MKQKRWKALPMLLMMAVLGGGSVRTWKNLAVQAADAAALTTDTVEMTAQESVPFYHGMINLNTFFQMTLGKNVIEDTAEGDEVVKLKNGYLTFVCEPADVTESARSLLSLQETCKENGAELYFVLTPQKISKYDPELPTGVQDNYNPMADAFLAQLGGQVHCTDLRQVIHENGINQYNFFFKTDHHWTPEGAFWCWGQVAQILKSEYGFVFDDAITDLMDKDVPALYDAAMAEHGFVAVADPVYDLVSVKKDEGFVATATVALQPELNLTKTTGFVSECVTPEVSDKEIDNVLERHRAAAAELVPHKGPAVKGNIVHIDYEGLLEGKPFQGGTAQNQAVQLGSGRMIPGFEEGILGHKAGEEFEIFVTFPNRYHAKDLAGKPVVFKVKLIDVCVRQIPALNSDFAKKVANLDTMDQLRAQVRQQLHDGKHAAALNRAKDQILTQLADASEGELPSVLVETTYQQQMEQIQQQLQMQRLSLDRYLSQIHETRESFTAKVRSSAEKTSRVHMALLQIAQQENLLPTEEEIEKTLAERAERSKKTLDEVKANSNIPAMRRNEGIRKAADWVIEHSTIEDKAESK